MARTKDVYVEFLREHIVEGDVGDDSLGYKQVREGEGEQVPMKARVWYTGNKMCPQTKIDESGQPQVVGVTSATVVFLEIPTTGNIVSVWPEACKVIDRV